MVTVRVCSQLKTRWESVGFLGVFNKTIIPLVLAGYEIIIANSYPTRTRGIIVEYTSKHYKDHFREGDRDLTICLALVI